MAILPIVVIERALHISIELDGRLVDDVAHDGVNLAVPWSALGQRAGITTVVAAAGGEPVEALACYAVVQVDGRSIGLVLLHHGLHERLAANMRYFSMLLLQLADFLSLHRVARLHAWRLPCEDVLNRKDLVKELELLLGYFLVLLGDGHTVELEEE